MKTIFLILLNLLALSCLASNEYRWLEQTRSSFSDQRFSDWQDAQSTKTKEFENQMSSSLTSTLNNLLEKPYLVDIPLKTKKLASGQTISLILEKETLKQVLKIDDEVIFDEKDIRPFSNFSSFSVDPLNQYIVVPVYSMGSTDRVTLHILSIAKKSILMSIPDALAYGASWSEPHKLKIRLPGGDFGIAMLVDPREQTLSFASRGDFFNSGDDNQFLTNISSEYIDGNLVRQLKIKVFGQEKAHEISLDHLDPGFGSFGMKKRLNSVLVFEPYGRFNKTFCTLSYRFTFNGDAHFGKFSCHELPTLGKISGFFQAGEHFIYETLYGFERKLHLFSPQGKLLKKFDSPKSGSLAALTQKDSKTLILRFRSPVKAKHEVELNTENFNLDLTQLELDLMTDDQGESYTTSYFSVPSSDNAFVPVRMVYKNTTPLDQNSKLFFEAYGGHGLITSFKPSFSRPISYFLKAAGVYVSPAVRGGGELGAAWHEAGRFLSKLKTYEDVENSVEYLHQTGIGSPSSTALMGWSSGGLMVNAVTSRRPDLFKLVIPGNGLSDLIRKEILDLDFGNGWSSEYGGHIVDEERDFLKSYSPLIKVQTKREYPTTYIIAGDHDSRVNPAHSYKITQALQNFQAGSSPIILNTVKNSGHWPTSAAYMGLSGLKTTQKLWSVIFSELELSTQALKDPLSEKANIFESISTGEILREEVLFNQKREWYETQDFSIDE